MSSEESEEAIEVDAIDVFPDAFDFIERKIGYILRFSFLLELDVDHLITAYLTAEPRSVEMLRGGILPYLALDVRVRLVKDIVDILGRSQDFPDPHRRYKGDVQASQHARSQHINSSC